jgi:hypothetical protein
MAGDGRVLEDRESGGVVARVNRRTLFCMDTLPYRFIGQSTDGLLIFQDLDYPSDAPQAYPDNATLHMCASTDSLIDGEKYFCVTERHAEVRGLIGRALEGRHERNVSVE